MHRVASKLVQAVMLGVSRTEVFLRVDGAAVVEGLAAKRLGLAVLLAGAEPRRIDLWPNGNGQAKVAHSRSGAQAGC